MIAVRALVLFAVLLTSASAPPIRATVFDHTGLRLTDVVWTGDRFLYVENTTNALWTKGSPPILFASMPRVVEETRCKMSPGTHGFPTGYLFCHSPDNVIYRVRLADGTVSVFARLPAKAIADGALAFDTVGRFGFRLLAATGRSGAASRRGGTVYAVSAGGAVQQVGSYSARGGADELIVAPAHFGSASGQIVLTVDAGKTGSLVLMDDRGRARTIAPLPDGSNPIVSIPSTTHAVTGTQPGLYATDTKSTNVFFVPASKLRRYAGSLLVGSELRGLFWTVTAGARGLSVKRIPLTLPGEGFNLENAIYLG
ncbi:MAG: hypothetical protein ACJ77E_07615 [Gaiellaceae bacterium]